MRLPSRMAKKRMNIISAKPITVPSAPRKAARPSVPSAFRTACAASTAQAWICAKEMPEVSCTQMSVGPITGKLAKSDRSDGLCSTAKACAWRARSVTCAAKAAPSAAKGPITMKNTAMVRSAADQAGRPPSLRASQRCSGEMRKAMNSDQASGAKNGESTRYSR